MFRSLGTRQKLLAVLPALLLSFARCASEPVLPANERQAPPPLELVGVLHDDRSLYRPHDVELEGDIAFVPGKGGTLALIDVSNPARPALLSSLVDPVLLEDAETVLPMGDVLLLGTRDFLAVDIRDPKQPTIVRKISDRSRIDKINGMARRDQYVFTANKTGFVTVFDVSNPSEPEFIDGLDTKRHGGLEKPHDIAMFGDHIVVVDAARPSPANVRLYRVIDPDSGRLLPAQKWVIEGAIPTGNELRFDLGGANRVAVGGDFAFVGAFFCDRVGVIDLRDPRRLVQVANMPSCDIDSTGMTLVGQALFVSGGECVEAIDVSDPQEPVSIAQYRAGELFPTRRILLGGARRYDNGHDLVYRDGYLYVTAQNDNRFGILKVNDPRVLELVSRPPPTFPISER